MARVWRLIASNGTSERTQIAFVGHLGDLGAAPDDLEAKLLKDICSTTDYRKALLRRSSAGACAAS